MAQLRKANKHLDALTSHYKHITNVHLRDLFKNKARFKQLSVCDDNIGLVFDYSKNILTSETKVLLLDFIRSIKLHDYINKMFSGEKINCTENRAVLHIALRNRINHPIYLDGKNVMPDINLMLNKMKYYSDQIRDGSWRGITGKKIKNIVSIGIGGSNIGPEMACKALRCYSNDNLNVYFVSNVDASDIYSKCNKLNINSTVFIISSKTFKTSETMSNALIAKKWIINKLGYKALKKHCFAITTESKTPIKFGIDKDNILTFGNFVCGRYSTWSAIGFPIACYIGFNNFVEFLNGAYYIDTHFKEKPYEMNIPVIMAMLSLWYTNFFQASTYAILPYSYDLRMFPNYIQQLEMESNGKNINRKGQKIAYNTAPIFWGDVGTNCQHSFFQLLHQGTRLIPCDFIGFIKPLQNLHGNNQHHKILMANYFAQTQALAFGLRKSEFINNNQHTNNNDIEKIIQYKLFEGNQPTTSILFDQLTPKTLGALMALYEHKTFVEGILWDINSFDQWGVELGKNLASRIRFDINKKAVNNTKYDVSTYNLLNIFNSKSQK